MPKREFATIEELQLETGKEVAVTDWIDIAQDRIDKFAEASGDFQWIHVDAARAQRESPFGTTIAHGFLTLALVSQFAYAAVGIREPFAMMINYGVNKVRFPAPVRCGSRIRSRHKLLEVSAIEGGWQTRWLVTIEVENQPKPACVAETITRYYQQPPQSAASSPDQGACGPSRV